MKSWPATTLRVFGILHILIGLLGISEVVWVYFTSAPRALVPSPQYPYALPFYCVYTIVVLLCLVFLIRAGVALWRLEPRGRWLSNVVLSFEVIWCWAEWETILVLLPLWGDKAKYLEDSMLVASGTWISGELQVLTGYPLIALVAINLAYRRLRRPSAVPASIPGKIQAGWKPWPRALLRALGALDIVVGLWGLNVAAVWYVLVSENKTGVGAAHPYLLLIYRIETIAAVVCFLLLIPTGVALWRVNRLGARISRGLLGFAVAFLVIDLGLRRILLSAGGEAGAIGKSFENSLGVLWFFVPITVYLLVVVIATTVAFRRMAAASTPPASAAPH
jgi:hypothetical protein